MTAPADDRRSALPIGASVTIEQLEHDPKPVLAELRRHEPVSWLPALGAWLVSRRDLAIAAMRDAETYTVDDPRFTTAAVLGPSMLSLDGPEHQRHRAPFAPAFRPAVLRHDFEVFLRDEVETLIDAFGHRGGDLRTGLAGPLAVNTITRFLGLDGVAPSEVLDWYQSISRAITDLTIGQVVADADRSAVEAVRRRVQAALGGSDSTSLLEAVRSSGALRPDEMGSAVLVLMFGAIETAEGMTANAFWHLLNTPKAWATLVENRALLPNAVEESLRHEPAAAVIDRYATRTTTLGDVTIPAGDLVTISLIGANHDPGHFDDPHAYDLARTNARQHVSFAQGPHGCLGLHLTRMETTAAISAMLDRAPELVLDPHRSAAPRGLIFRKPPTLQASW